MRNVNAGVSQILNEFFKEFLLKNLVASTEHVCERLRRATPI